MFLFVEYIMKKKEWNKRFRLDNLPYKELTRRLPRARGVGGGRDPY